MELQLNPDIARPLKTRIAPTPSGYLHLGNIFSFAITWAIARKHNGLVVLRIDDLDNTRFRQEYLHDIFATLQFMGIDYDEGPEDAAGFYKSYSQQHKLSLYNSLLQQLVAQNVVYACPCSRTQLAGRIQEGSYPFTCRHKQLPLALHQAAWRLRIPEDTVVSFSDLLLQNCDVLLSESIPDFIIRRKDGVPAYQIASLCDDLRMGINLVVRGEDLLPSTAAQLHLAQLLGEDTFKQTQFLHHPVLFDLEGKKLCKSHDSLSILEMRNNGATAADIWGEIARQLNWNDAPITDSESFLQRFDLDEFVAHAATARTH